MLASFCTTAVDIPCRRTRIRALFVRRCAPALIAVIVCPFGEFGGQLKPIAPRKVNGCLSPQGSEPAGASSTIHKGMDAMRIHRTLWLLTVAASLTGCRSNAGAGWSVWNPFSAWGKETAVASTDPTLPSQKFAATDKSSAPTGKTSVASATPSASRAATSAPAYTPPAAVARTAAATPTTPSYSAATTPAAPAYSPVAPSSSTPTTSMSNSLASGASAPMTGSTGPYNPNGYTPAAPVVAAESTPGVNRYGMPDRYATSTPSTTTTTTAPAMSATFPTPSYSTGGRYATYETPTSAATATAPAASTPQQVAPASATVNLTTPPGQYRPAGTSSYPVTSAEQVNVASLPEKPVATPPATTQPAGTTGYPSTGAPAPGSVYGVPSYR